MRSLIPPGDQSVLRHIAVILASFACLSSLGAADILLPPEDAFYPPSIFITLHPDPVLVGNDVVVEAWNSAVIRPNVPVQILLDDRQMATLLTDLEGRIHYNFGTSELPEGWHSIVIVTPAVDLGTKVVFAYSRSYRCGLFRTCFDYYYRQLRDHAQSGSVARAFYVAYPPQILKPPTSITASPGVDVGFDVTAKGTGLGGKNSIGQENATIRGREAHSRKAMLVP